MAEPLVLAVANQKGGVGKTTTAVNLSAALAARGLRTLLLDLDIQGSASACLGMTPTEDEFDVSRAMLEDASLDRALRPTRIDRLTLAAAGERMSMVDLHLASVYGRERVLERALRGPAVQDHDVIVIDTAPYLGLLTVNALVCSHKILVPVSCEYLPVLGLKLLNETVEKLRDRAGSKAELLGYVLTMYDRRERITGEVEELLRERFGSLVFDTVIRANTLHKSAPSHRRTIFEHEPEGGKGREDYEALGKEVMKRAGLSVSTSGGRKAKVKSSATSSGTSRKTARAG